MKKILLCLFLIHTNTAYSANCEHDTQDSILCEAANSGDAGAQVTIGSYYYYGNGAPKDYKTAADWYTKAAIQGNEHAQYSLGEMYFQGEGVPQDYQQALKWFHKSGEQGNAGAQFRLGSIYENGDGVSPDFLQSGRVA